ncbi:two-component regulator propeller domain-containing protein [Bacteroidota bacterium]
MKKLLLLNLIFSITLLGLTLISCDKQVSVSEPHTDTPDNKIIVETLPHGAAIFMNGDNTGKTTPDSIVHLEPNDYVITLKRELFLDTSAVISLLETETERFYVNYFKDARNFGKIECFSEPENAEIFLDDSCTGLYTPAVLEFIWPGRHEIKYAYPEHRADSIEVTLHASTTEQINIELQDTSVVVDYHSMNSEFPTNMTWCIAVDKSQHQWIGTMDRGLIQFKDGQWISYNRNNSPLPTNSINYIAVDDFNNKWIGTQKGLVKIDANDNWTIYTTENSGLPNNFINSIAFDKTGNTWIAASQPIGAKALVKLTDNNFYVYNVDKIINTITIDHENRVWVGTDSGLRLLENGEWRNDLTDTLIIHDRRVLTMACDNQGRIYIGITRNVFNQLHPPGLYVYYNGVLTHKPTSEPLITHIHAAENGNIWVCTYGFYISPHTDPDACILYKIDPGDMITEYTQNNLDINGYFLMQSATQSNGDLWIASRRNGIIKFKGANL